MVSLAQRGHADMTFALSSFTTTTTTVDVWAVWVRASAQAAASGARRVYDRLVGKLEEAGVRLNLLPCRRLG